MGGDGEPAWTDAAVTARDVRLAREEALDGYPDAAAATILGWCVPRRWTRGGYRLDGGPVLLPRAGGRRLRPTCRMSPVQHGMRAPAASARTSSQAIETRRAIKSSTYTLTFWRAGSRPNRKLCPTLGREFPDDFPERLRRAVVFILDD